MELWTQASLVAVLVLLNAAFAGTEMALVNLRDGQLARLREQGGAGAVLARLAEDPNQFLATIQIGITLAGFLASATAAVSFAEPLVEPLESVVGGAARPLSIVLVTLVLTYVTLVVGELVPKRVALQRAERWGLLAARPLAWVATITRPAVWLLAASTDLLVRLVGADPEVGRQEITEEDLRDMVAVHSELTDHERRIIDGAFEFADRTLREIVVPRTRVVALDATVTAAEATRRLADTGHSRAPVMDGDLDHVLGTVHLRALVGVDGPVLPHVQPVLEVPETVTCLVALRRMQAQRQPMLVVIDEFGGTQGIVTVEDLLEELVGEIYDEDDPDVQAVQRHDDGSMTIAGAYPIHDLSDIGIAAPAGDYTTLAGLILAELGRVPHRGETVEIEGWCLVVEASDRRTITRVRAKPCADP